MIEHSRPDGAGSIIALENELLVRDFIDLLNDGAVSELRGFLHPDVQYRASSAPAVSGCDLVLALLQQFLDAFEHVRFRIQTIGLAERIVLVQHLLELQLPGDDRYQLDSFASFELRDYQIVRWQQVHA